jgi:hypothetical protein
MISHKLWKVERKYYQEYSLKMKMNLGITASRNLTRLYMFFPFGKKWKN